MKKRLFITLLAAVLMPFIMQAQSNSQGVFSSVSSCGSYTWAVTGQTYTSSQVVTYTSHDTIYTLALTINPEYHTATSIVPVTACSLSWIDSLGTTVTLTQSGIYYGMRTTTMGCDSIVAVNFTKATSAHRTLDTTVCGTFYWHYGNNKIDTLTSSTTINNRHELVNGCDSILSLHLTMNQPQQINTDTVVRGCELTNFSFWGKTKQYTSDTTFNTDDFMRANNLSEGSNTWKKFHGRTIARCYDSISTAHIIINYKSYTNRTVKACDSYTFSGVYYTYNYNYSIDTITNDSTLLSIDTIAHNYEKDYVTSKVNDTIKVGYNVAQCDSLAILNVTIHTSPTVTIAGDLSVNPGSNATVYAVCNESNVTYKWNNDPSKTNDSLVLGTLYSNTDVSIQATNKTTQCVGTNYVTVLVNAGIENPETAPVRLYPNPAASKLNVECTDNITNLTIYNIVGQRVMNVNNLNAKSVLDLNHLSNGTYTMRIQLNNGSVCIHNFVVTK